METLSPVGKFVLLLHKDKGADHFDLILEGQDLCPTFQFKNELLNFGVRIKDHRKKYLSFVGFISADKGTVTTHDKGEYLIANNQLILNGEKMSISFSIKSENNLIKQIN